VEQQPQNRGEMADFGFVPGIKRGGRLPQQANLGVELLTVPRRQM
jgi:hypothetical protein